jgi:hypothetical protein
MSTSAAKGTPSRERYSAEESELLNDFAAYLVHCDLRDSQEGDATQGAQAVTDGKPKNIDT